MVSKRWLGVTYPSFLSNRLVKWLWQKLMCPRHHHLFDEVLSSEDHSLYCDACGLYAVLEGFDFEFCKVEFPEEK